LLGAPGGRTGGGGGGRPPARPRGTIPGGPGGGPGGRGGGGVMWGRWGEAVCCPPELRLAPGSKLWWGGHTRKLLRCLRLLSKNPNGNQASKKTLSLSLACGPSFGSRVLTGGMPRPSPRGKGSSGGSRAQGPSRSCRYRCLVRKLNVARSSV